MQSGVCLESRHRLNPEKALGGLSGSQARPRLLSWPPALFVQLLEAGEAFSAQGVALEVLQTSPGVEKQVHWQRTYVTSREA